MNVVAIVLAVVGAFSYNESPLSAVQMLWINMIMDSLASLALATELPTPALLDRAPYGRRRSVLSGVLLFNVAGHSIYQICVLLAVLLRPDLIPTATPVPFEPRSGSLHWSVFFNVFVWLQVFNELNARKLQTVKRLRAGPAEWMVLRGLLSNSMFVAVMVFTVVLQVVIVQFGGASVNLVAGGLPRDLWAFCVAVGAFSLVWQFVVNLAILAFLPDEAARAKDADAADVGLLPSAVATAFSSGASTGSSRRSASEASVMAELGEPETACSREAKRNWGTVRHRLRYGRVYARAFGMPLGKAVELRKRGSVTLPTRKESELLHQAARNFSRELASASSQ